MKHDFYIETFTLGENEVKTNTFSYPATRQLISFLRKLSKHGHFVVFLKDLTSGKELLDRR